MSLFQKLFGQKTPVEADRKDSGADTPAENGENKALEKPAVLDKSQYEAIANRMFPGIAMFARDVNLAPAIASVYKPGMIICERGFTDATCRFMGMPTTHRYVILSNHMANFSQFEKGTNWGLCVAQHGAHFKVMGTVVHQGKTGIFLLHLPDDDTWKIFQNTEFSVEKQVYEMAKQRFIAKCTAPVPPELADEKWLDRCRWPLGTDDSGHLFPL